jgi:surface polysaccharide O-acyltransferase-like enzyme
MSEFIIYLKKESSRKQKLEKFTFLLAGVSFLIAVMDNINSDRNVFDGLDYIYNAVMLVTGIINIIFGSLFGRIKENSVKELITRLLFTLTGTILIIDGIHKILLEHNLIQYFLIAAGLLYFMLGAFYPQIQKLKSVKLNKEGISWRTSPFIKHTFLWNDISSLYLEEKRMTITLLNKKNYKINLSSVNDDDHDELVKKVREFSDLDNSELTASNIFLN